MITAGVDAGAECLKVVLLDEGGVIATACSTYGKKRVSETAIALLDEAAGKAGHSRDEIDLVVAAGTQRNEVSFATATVSDPLCCARGAAMLLPSTRVLIDLGADGCTVMRLEGNGVTRIARNERCAAGTGRFVKTVSDLLHLTADEAGRLSLQSKNPQGIEATCSVFAESEIISLIHQGHPREDIIKGAFKGLAQRIYPLVAKVGIARDVTLVGGVATNVGVSTALHEQIGLPLLVPEEPIFVQALGAAIVAREIVQSKHPARVVS